MCSLLKSHWPHGQRFYVPQGERMTVIQIVPGIAPQVDGIGDYALQLARQLRERHNIQTIFAVCDPGWKGEPALEGFAVRSIAARSPGAFLKLINECNKLALEPQADLMLHVSPYGYQRYGVPFWLVEALKSYVKVAPGSLNLCFHELEVTGARPWSSAFWVPPFQKHILKSVARLGRFRYTNTELHRRKLESWGCGLFELIPNFSTIEEPKSLPPFSERRRDLVIFGRPATRIPLYSVHRKRLVSLCKHLAIERIIDIGSPIEPAEPSIDGISVVRCGRLPETEVAQWMASSLALFLSYPVKFLTKSSVHAVACAHGTITFLSELKPDWTSTEGLVTGVDFIPITDDTSNLGSLQFEELCSSIFSNYSRRSSATASDRVASALLNTR